MHDFWVRHLREHENVIREVGGSDSLLAIEKVGSIIAEAIGRGGRLLICGNGGSAADAQHIAAELVGRFGAERKPLDAEALSVNTSCLTAIGNDYGFDSVFARQVEARGRPGDVLLAISTSGGSINIIRAVETAGNLGLVTVGLTGGNRESELCRLCDYSICVPSTSVPRIQEAHILIGHMLCGFVEDALGDGSSGVGA